MSWRGVSCYTSIADFCDGYLCAAAAFEEVDYLIDFALLPMDFLAGELVLPALIGELDLREKFPTL